MAKQYWADAATMNCVWLFQVGTYKYGDNGCSCDELGEDEDCDLCGVHVWHTKKVFLTEKEAMDCGVNSGIFGKDWRIYGVPCDGIMAKMLGRHVKECESGT